MSVDRATIAALRFGYGFRPGQQIAEDREGLLASVTRPISVDEPEMPGLERILEIARKRRDAGRSMRKGEDGAEEMRDAAMKEVRGLRIPMLVRRVLTPILSPHGFRERLVSFWADHFTVSARGAMLVLTAPHHVEKAIRPNIAGRFADLLIAAELHPAMIFYLNQNISIGPSTRAARRRRRVNGLNENLAREILELHTLGVDGQYTQKDVREFAELLTGYTADLKQGTRFVPRFAEPGAEHVLGRDYGGAVASPEDARRALADLAIHPDTARHIARKLVVHFVSDTPDPDHVAAVEAAWNETGGDLMAVYDALLRHPGAWVPEFAKTRQPFDFLVAALRGVGAGTDDHPLGNGEKLGKFCFGHLNRMGQRLMAPPGPNGWPEEEEAWITPQGLAARIAFARAVAQRGARDIDPRDFLDTVLGPAAGPGLRWAVAAAEQRWEGIVLTLLSPEFNHR
ncbi:MAG: DUF1800 domain-containing protein [Alphaproteobacteria bacterium]|nr:MAG: DUF1800 domain-containing protein [Alphaproteobacteria bacterium]